MATNLRGYFRTEPTSADLARLCTARRRLADARALLACTADHLRDVETRDPDTGDHPLTADGRALAELQFEVNDLICRLDSTVATQPRTEVDR